MTPERWQQVKELLAAVLEQRPESRRSFLEQAIDGDEELRAEVESLLSHQEAGDSIVDSPRISSQISLARAITDEFLSGPSSWLATEQERELREISHVGPYKIISHLGQGGVGSVFLAERDTAEYRRRVALKLIRRGMDTDFVVLRFRNERQILAALDHPNIARLIDGGTTENDRPYLVMEYVEGTAIDTYCDEHALNIEERLKLFQQVCAAVHYAHQHLVIHRDIKPSNILVTKDGVPKLLDFGIAKLLTPELAAQTLDPTLTAMRLLTPAYASPEQIKGGPITTASDVYSLGVLLHELLTGHKPYSVESRTPLDIMKAVLEQDATKPSTAAMMIQTGTNGDDSPSTTLTPESISKARSATPDGLRRRLRGDLDNIVLMALRKDPLRRYTSVQQFSEDISRHLDGLPVIARPDTFSYRAGKFIRRNRIAVGAAAIVLLILVGGILAINQQRQRAERRFNDVRKLARSVVFDYHDAIANLPGSTPARQRMVKDALEYLDSLTSEASGDRTLQRELAAAYQKIGDVQGNSNMANLGDTAGALLSYQKSLAMRRSLVNAEPANKELQLELVESYERIGDVLRVTGEVHKADESYQLAIALLEKLPTDELQQRKLADLLYRDGNLKSYPRTSNLGDTQGGLESHQRALDIRERLAQTNPIDVDLQVDLAESHRSLANIRASAGNNPLHSEPNARRAVTIAQELVAREPSHSRALRVLTEAQDALARILLLKRQLPEALTLCLESLRNAERLVAIDPRNMQARQDLASGHMLAGNIFLQSSDTAKALEHHHKSLEMNQAMAADDPNNDAANRWISQNYMNIATTLRDAGKLEEALRNFRQALSVSERLYESNSNDNQAIQQLARLFSHMGDLLWQTGHENEALANLQRSLELSERVIARDSGNDRIRRVMALNYFYLGEIYSRRAARTKKSEERQQHLRESCAAYQKSLELYAEVRSRGLLPKEAADQADQLPRKLAACDAAQAKQR